MPPAIASPLSLPMSHKRKRTDIDHQQPNLETNGESSDQQRHNHQERKTQLEPRTPSPLSRGERQPVLPIPSPVWLPPLTERNLKQHTQRVNPELQHDERHDEKTQSDELPDDMVAATSSAESTTDLVAYGVRPNYGAENIPQLLKNHIQAMKRERPDVSPSAQALHRLQLSAKNSGEHQAIEILNDYLLFKNEVKGGEPYIANVLEDKFNVRYVTRDDGLSLQQPKPDSLLGYMTRENAGQLGVLSKFTRAEDLQIQPKALTSRAHYPCVTMQYKAYSGDSLYQAELQLGRDGTAVINNLYELFTDAGMNPTVVDTCHWSLTSDTSVVYMSHGPRGRQSLS